MKKGSLLGIDYGERRIGLAISDPEQKIAFGVTTIDVKNNSLWKYLEEIIKEENIVKLIVGYPLRTDGKESDKAKKVDNFIIELENHFSLPVAREDEAFTSSVAKDIIKNRATKKKHKNMRTQKEEIDKLAACILLQDYLDRNYT